MSLFVWPDTTVLPNPQNDLSNKIVANVIRTQMDSGRSRQRKRFTAASRTFSASWSFTDNQYAIYQGILQYKLNDGADFFTMSLPCGNGFNNYTVRFIDNGISAAYQDVMYWKVTATLESFDAISPIDEATLDASL